MDEYLSKPYTELQLAEVLGHWLPGGASAGEPAGLGMDPGRSPPASAAGPEAPLEPCALDGIRALQQPGRPNLVRRVIDLYLESAPQLLARIRASLAEQDAHSLTDAAHSFKSSSANVGAAGLAALCKDLEAQGRSGDLTAAAQAVAGIAVEFERVEQALRILATGPSQGSAAPVP
jgi:HPt (histidine-containing phosphotransfer) domain-containing protein